MKCYNLVEATMLPVVWYDGQKEYTTYHTPEEKALWDERNNSNFRLCAYLKKMGIAGNELTQKDLDQKFNRITAAVEKRLKLPENRQLLNQYLNAKSIILKNNALNDTRKQNPVISRQVVDATKLRDSIIMQIVKRYGNQIRLTREV